jgi:hypothetical protein
MIDDWKNDRAEAAMREQEASNMVKAAADFKTKLQKEREESWLAIYEQCKKCSSSPSMTKAVIQWFIDNDYNVPTKIEKTTDEN